LFWSDAFRDLEHSTVLYDTENNLPLLRLAWNRKNPNYLAIIAMEKNYITIIDIRHPLQPVAKLSNHKSCVNAMAWAPQSNVHICSAGDD